MFKLDVNLYAKISLKVCPAVIWDCLHASRKEFCEHKSEKPELKFCNFTIHYGSWPEVCNSTFLIKITELQSIVNVS